MMPRTANLPSDLMETHALSLARTVTSNVCAPSMAALFGDFPARASPGAVAFGNAADAPVCLAAVTPPFFASAAFKLIAPAAVGLAVAFCGGRAVVLCASALFALTSGTAEGDVTGVGLLAAGVTVVVELAAVAACRFASRSRARSW